VLGGGALGLTVALRLAQRGEAVTVFEREPEAGGLASGFRPSPELPDGGPFLEKFYHHLFRSDTAVTALIEELGLGGRMVWPTPINAVVRGGRIWQPYTPLGLLKFSLLPLLDRARMAAALAYLKVQRNYRQFAGWTAHDWLRRWMGGRAYNVLWNPLLRAKFGDRFDRVAMPWFWARIHYRSFDLGYLDGGFQLLYEALVAEIRRLGGEVRLRTEVVEASVDGGEWTVAWREVGSGETQRGQFERVVSTLPTRLTIRLIPQLPDEYKRQYDWGEAYGAHCLVLALDRPMMEHGEYWLNVNDPGFPFLVLVEHTNYRPPAAYGGKRLVYLGNYLPMDHPLFRKTKEEILAEFLPALRRINPAFEEEWVQESWSFGAPYAQPIVTREYPEHIPPLKGPLPGLWIGSMFQVYPQDRGQNYSVALANRLAGEILSRPG
jgi:protoporphyrinogen oxidase